MGRLRIGYTDSEASYDDRVAEAALPGDAADAVTDLGLPLALIPSEALGIAERRLAEARVARDSISVQHAALGAELGAGGSDRVARRIHLAHRPCAGPGRARHAGGAGRAQHGGAERRPG
jgi:hypothetical protein